MRLKNLEYVRDNIFPIVHSLHMLLRLVTATFIFRLWCAVAIYCLTLSCFAYGQNTLPREQTPKPVTNAKLRHLADSLQEQALKFCKNTDNYASAIPLQLEALHIWRDLADSTNIARALDVLSRGFAAIGDTDRARRYIDEALLLFDRQHTVRPYLTTLVYLALLEQASGRVSAAAAALERADAYIVLRHVQDSLLIPSSLYGQKAEFALRGGDYEAALRYNAISARLFALKKTNASATNQGANKCAEAVFLARVWCAQGRWSAALQLLSPVRADSTRAGLLKTSILLDWYQTAAKAFAGARRYDSAYVYECAARAIHDTLQSRTKAQTLANLQIRYDVERKDERFRALEREQQLQNRTVLFLVFGIALLLALLLLAAWAYRLKQRGERLLQERNRELRGFCKSAIESFND